MRKPNQRLEWLVPIPLTQCGGPAAVTQYRLSLSDLLTQNGVDGYGLGADTPDWPDGAAQMTNPDASLADDRGHGHAWSMDTLQVRLQAEREWLSSISALAQLLLQMPPPVDLRQRQDGQKPLMGLAVCGPFPVLPDQLLGRRLSNWLLVPQALEGMLAVARPLLPSQGTEASSPVAALQQMVPLRDDDPVASERFCLIITASFSLSLVLGRQGLRGQPQFQFSFDPSVNQQVWQQLRSRVAQARPPLLSSLEQVAETFPLVVPDYRLVTQFGRLVLEQLRRQPQASTHQTSAPSPSSVQFAAVSSTNHAASFPARPLSQLPAFVAPSSPPSSLSGQSPEPGPSSNDAELLKAMAHEISTPLTTIRTFTRSLLKRQDLPEAVIKRLTMIDRECTQQIDRFNLIFRAVELETEASKQPKSPLSPISLTHLFQTSIPLWQQQASRRNLTLDVKFPAHLPQVTSDPTMLNQVLTGLIERFTQSLPPHSHIELVVTLAGHQLKLQFQSHPPETETDTPDHSALFSSPFKALGQLLMFQPETGGLSLNLNATKNLFQALGGKLIVRQRPQAGEVLTVFLPLETRTL